MNINEKLLEIKTFHLPNSYEINMTKVFKSDLEWLKSTVKQLQEENEKLMQLSRGFIEQVKKSEYKDENEHHIEMNSSYMDLVFYVGEKESLDEQVRKCMISAGVDPGA